MIIRGQSLADQVRQQILNWIRANRIEKNGGMIPSETELSEMFATSRATVREALAQLERERLVIRRQGSGTYISPSFHKLTTTINELRDPLDMIQRQGTAATVGSVEYALTPARAEDAQALEIKPGDATLDLCILYLIGDVPAALLKAVIPVFGVFTERARIPPFTGLMRFAAEISGWNATHSIATLQAIAASEAIAGALQVSPGQPLFVMEETYLTDSGRPAFLSTLNILSARIELDLLRNSDQSANQVVIW